MNDRSPRRSRAGTALSLVLALLVLAGTASVLACFPLECYSVRFHWQRPDFFQMPQPWRGVPEELRALWTPRPAAFDPEGSTPIAYLGPDTQRRVRHAERAVGFEAAGQFRRAAAEWARYQQERSLADPWEVITEGYEPLQAQALDDRLSALRSWRGPQDTPALRTYLRARDLVTGGKYDRARPLLSQLTRGPYRTRARYLAASLRFHTEGPEAAAAAFRAYLAQHPRDPLALYMLGRCYFRAIRVDEKTEGRRLDPDQRRRYLRHALAGYQACVAAEPHGPLAEDARGKMAACLFRLGHRVDALVRYCEQLAATPPLSPSAPKRGRDPSPGRDNHFAFLSARLCLRRMDLAEHRAFQSRTVSRPDVASVYLDLHLHFGRPGLRASENLGRFAIAVLRLHPAAPLSGRLLIQVAVIEGRFDHWKRAERLAAAAIQRCAPGGYRDQARWQRALALRQLHRRREASGEYERLAAGAVVPKMRRGAHEAAAILAEERCDLPTAIRHYFALQYRPDYAYLIDCVASQHDLRDFLRRWPDHPQARLVRYSLGFRQLRAGQYAAAARTFASLGAWLAIAEKRCDCRTARNGPRWPPLRLARFLADASRREAAARTDAEGARAAYSRARALFHQRYLALYNGALWEGSRIYTLDLTGFGVPSTGVPPLRPREQQRYDRYQEEHAVLYQALRIFERIASRYPRTPEAPKALYSAALCHTLLDHMDRYWGERELGAVGQAIRLYRQLQRDYPDHPLAAAAAKYGGPLPPSTPGSRRGAGRSARPIASAEPVPQRRRRRP